MPVPFTDCLLFKCRRNCPTKRPNWNLMSKQLLGEFRGNVTRSFVALKQNMLLQIFWKTVEALAMKITWEEVDQTFHDKYKSLFTYSSLSSSDNDDGDAPQNALIPEKENIFVLYDNEDNWIWLELSLSAPVDDFVNLFWRKGNSFAILPKPPSMACGTHNYIPTRKQFWRQGISGERWVLIKIAIGWFPRRCCALFRRRVALEKVWWFGGRKSTILINYYWTLGQWTYWAGSISNYSDLEGGRGFEKLGISFQGRAEFSLL